MFSFASSFVCWPLAAQEVWENGDLKGVINIDRYISNKGICDIFDKERSDGIERTGGGIRRRNDQVSFLVTDFSERA